MTRKHNNHTLQTNPRHHKEEPHNTNSHKILESEYDQEIQESHIADQSTAP